MARIRSVSPALRMSETVAAWDIPCRYTWVLLWGYLDDYGRGVDNARLIAADCYPLDDDITSEMMEEWLETYRIDGSICRYEVEGKRYLHSLNWSEHQKPQHPSKVRIPPCTWHEPGAHKKWSDDREKERTKVSGESHEGLVSHSPTSSSRGEVSLELSEGVERGASSGAKSTPPLFPEHCDKHASTALPGKCGDCADARKAGRALTVVPDGTPWPLHCGQCDENRQRTTPFGVIRCPECHPLAGEETA